MSSGNSVKDETSGAILDRNIFFLRHYTWIEYYIALLLLISAFVLRPIIVLVPPLVIWCFVLFWEPAPQDVKSRIKPIFPGFGWLLVRQTKKSHDMAMVRVPFLRLLFIPESEYRWLRTAYSRGRLLHEFGHTRQYDVLVMLWLILSIIIWLRAMVCSLKSGPLFELVPASDMELRHGQEIYA